LSALLPPKVKLPFQFWALFVASVMPAPLVLSMVPPGDGKRPDADGRVQD
jgi:hypothetical protein